MNSWKEGEKTYGQRDIQQSTNGTILCMIFSVNSQFLKCFYILYVLYLNVLKCIYILQMIIHYMFCAQTVRLIAL